MNLKKFITAATFTFAAGAFCSGAFADDVKPILQHGKKNLYYIGSLRIADNADGESCSAQYEGDIVAAY